MKHFKKQILLTGGAGFIGSHAVRHFVNKYPEYLIINLDALTYAGNLMNLIDLESKPNYVFIRADIRERQKIQSVFSDFNVTHILHFAAESHVDRSISNPLSFVQTNVLGTCNLLELARENWSYGEEHLFYHISTDEVYGSLGPSGYFTEETPYDPRSPYSASKAASDHFVSAYFHTYGLPSIMSNCSNNYGPYQFPEKLIPLMIHNILQGKDLPVYGDGSNIRDWLYISDHVAAIDVIFHKGIQGECYNIGGNTELKNLELVTKLCDFMDTILENPQKSSRKLIKFVTDRPGHDQRYAIDSSKIRENLNWTPSFGIDDGLKATISWYLDNQEWLDKVTSGDYQTYYARQYHNQQTADNVK